MSRLSMLTRQLVIFPVLTCLYILGLGKVANAAVPGCYDSVGPTYIKISCPDSTEIIEGVNQAKCYVRRSVDGGPQGAATFVEQQCDTFDIESSDTDSGGDFTGGKESLASGEADSCDTNEALSTENCTIIRYLVVGINFLSAVALMSIIASIVYAGFQYMTARDNSGQVEASRKRIIWALVALGLFLFMYSLLDFLLPGGVF